MAPYSGKVLHLAADGSTAGEGPCQVSIGAEALTVTGPGRNSLSCDLGDIDALEPADYELALTLYTGQRLRFSHFGKTHPALAHDLVEAWRARLVACLLLEDLTEVARFDLTASLESGAGQVASPAELRLYETNVAVLPMGAPAFQWRLADIDRLDFDRAAYAITLGRGDDRLSLTRIGRRTDECYAKLGDQMAGLQARTLDTLRTIFPFLDPAPLNEAARLMPEGRAASAARLVALDKRVEPALRTNMADARLRPCFDALVRQSGIGGLYAGFRLVRPEDEPDEQPEPEPEASADAEPAMEEEQPVETGAEASPPDGEESQVLCWFFFALSSRGPGHSPDTVAWESTSKSGRATYLFSLSALCEDRAPGVDAAVRTLDRALGTLNFRREPIYLPDEALDLQARYHRYVIGARRIAELRALRRSFRGRALHVSLAGWQKQLEAALGR
jgi:hypothetical protein